MKNPSFPLWLALLWIIGCSAATAGETLNPVRGKPLATDFSLQDTDGNTRRLSDYRGRPVIVNFWATWCPPCRREMPSMERAWKKLQKQGVAMLAVDVGEDEDTVFGFTANYPVSFPLLLDQDSSVIGAWPVLGLPTTFVVDPQGRIVYKAVGGREWDSPELLQPILELRTRP